MRHNKYTALDFFAGSGLVSIGLSKHFESIWANDNCPKKASIYRANHSNNFVLGSIEHVSGADVPLADIAWASFPCVDISLAGKRGGLNAERSGLYWQWIRVLDEMPQKPPVLAIENVEGLYSSASGLDYAKLHSSLLERGYNVGPLTIDASHWVPQSRVRAIIIAVHKSVDISDLVSYTYNWAHTGALQRAIRSIDDVILWNLPQPKRRELNFNDIVEFDAPVDSPERTAKNIAMIPDKHLSRLMKLTPDRYAAAGYKRTRNGKQVLELRFDDLAGCLRTPRGGNSRQYVIIKNGNQLSSRLLTARETARLMGAPENFNLTGSYNEAYAAMGDAVAYPVVEYLANQLLVKLVQKFRESEISTGYKFEVNTKIKLFNIAS